MNNSARNSSDAVLAFDRVAADYERTRPLPDAVGDSVAQFIVGTVGEDDWLLDAGCGTGRFTRPLARHHTRTVAFDAAPAMLAELRRLQGSERMPLLVTGDLRNLPFADAQFATVLSVHVLHLVADWRGVLGEMWRTLAPGGTLFFGNEDREPSAVRDFYFREGGRLGLLPAHPGVRDTERNLLPVLEGWGATDVKRTAPDEWAWLHTQSVAGKFADLEARLYSSQWEIPDEAHRAILDATRAHAEAVFGALSVSSEDVAETIRTQFVLWGVRKG